MRPVLTRNFLDLYRRLNSWLEKLADKDHRDESGVFGSMAEAAKNSSPVDICVPGWSARVSVSSLVHQQGELSDRGSRDLCRCLADFLFLDVNRV